MNLKNTILHNKKHIHFIGIGGSGMFPIAQILNSKGYHISGSDNNESDTLSSVRDMGIKVYFGHSGKNIEGADLIVYSAAIMDDNEELIYSKNSGVEVIERAKLLGVITSLFENVLCVSGTHGKTTTSAMITQILEESNFNPTSIIGGKLPKINGNGKIGREDLLVCEACEFSDTFLNLFPDISVILNIDEDHLDYFKNLDNIIKSFSKFCGITSNTIIVNGDDKNSLQAISSCEKKIITFGLTNKNDYYPKNIVIKESEISIEYDLIFKDKKIADIVLKVPGEHNILNSVASCAAAIELGVSPSQLKDGLSDFRGASRRFEVLGSVDGVTIIDDYAHHPLEIELTLKALKSLKFNNIWAIFQPFTFSRTHILMEDFAKSLSLSDNVILTDIMGSREKNIYGVHSKDLQDRIKNCYYFDSFNKVKDFILLKAQAGDVIITMGCGDVYKIAKSILT